MSLRYSDRSHWDCRPVSLFGNSSAEALGRELGMQMDRRRFRANFYAEWEEAGPYHEDGLVGRTLQIGERLRIAVLERDPRCKMITLDPETGRWTSTSWITSRKTTLAGSGSTQPCWSKALCVKAMRSAFNPYRALTTTEPSRS